MAVAVVDAGVLIALLDDTDPHHEGAKRLLRSALARGDDLIVPASAYAETLVAPFRRGRRAAAIVDAFIDSLPATVGPATREVARVAAELRAKHGRRLRLPDALVLATGRVAKAQRVLTTDQEWPEAGLRVEVVGRG